MAVTINGTTGIVFNDSTAQSTAGTRTLTANGYQKLPSGIIIQWGSTGTLSGGQNFTVTYPIAFPAACVNVQTTVIASSDTNEVAYVYNVGTTTFVVANSNPGSIGVYWMAIGY